MLPSSNRMMERVGASVVVRLDGQYRQTSCKQVLFNKFSLCRLRTENCTTVFPCASEEGLHSSTHWPRAHGGYLDPDSPLLVSKSIWGPAFLCRLLGFLKRSHRKLSKEIFQSAPKVTWKQLSQVSEVFPLLQVYKEKANNKIIVVLSIFFGLIKANLK